MTTQRDRREWGQQLVDLAPVVEAMGRAMLDDDEILGVLAGQGIANHLTALPKHIRDLFVEYLTDEAVAGVKTDERYFEWADNGR